MGAFSQGYGKAITATDSAALTEGLRVNMLSVYNASGVIAYALVNCTAAELTAAVAAGTAVILPNGSSFTFDCQAHSLISSVALVLSSGSGTVYVNGF